MEPAPDPLTGAVVLLVGAEPARLAPLLALLEEHEARARVVAAADALDLARAAPPELLVLDLTEGDGEELCASWRAAPELAAVPALLLGEEPAVARALAAAPPGALDWLRDLARPAETRARLASLLLLGRARRRNELLDAELRVRGELLRRTLVRRQGGEAGPTQTAILAATTHELRTPLNAIIGFTRIVRRKCEDVLPPLQRENLDRVLEGAQRLLGLIDGVLEFAKLEAGGVTPRSVALDPWAIAAECVEATRPLLRPGVSLRAAPPAAPALALADAGRVRQVLLNLLGNAAKFTHEGEVWLALERRGAEVAVEVGDTGIGIAADQLERVFGEFQQASSSVTRLYGGTGLGLAISRRLARLMGGELAVTSRVGEGSVFRFTLPGAGEDGQGAAPGGA
ncbi:MAG: sensor histidine kinase [Planctomycetota bacterium]